MAILQTGARVIPGIDAAMETTEMDPTWGSWDINRTYVMGTQLDPAAEDVGNTTDSILRPGLIMEYNGTTQMARELQDPTLTDGDPYGILLYADSTGGKAKWFGYVLIGGQIRADGIIVPGASSDYGNLVGATDEAAIRAALAVRFILDDFRDNL